ncbi:MAG: hypothetical protein E7629_03515 [Ruminococcaceae bacterium]|nr:hypothetical protein [Oscillospiraceae bacterium]
MSVYKESFAESLKWGIGYCVVTLLIGAFILLAIILWLRHLEDVPKWVWPILSVFVLLICIMEIYSVSQMVYDYKNDAYVVYYGNYRQNRGGYDHFQGTILLDEEEKGLLTPFELSSNGEYYGYVVYSERSGYVVYVGETLPDQSE